MLTVNYKDQHGVEWIEPAVSVQFVPVRASERQSDDACAAPGVHLHRADGGFIHYGVSFAKNKDDEMREVFVMNDHGKTIAHYFL